MRTSRAFAAISCALLLGGCPSNGDGGDTGPKTPDPPQTTECPVGHPTPLALAAETQEEIQYLDKITACTNFAQTSTYLNNDADVVWTLSTTTGGEPVDQQTAGQRLASFRSVAAEIYPGALLSPNSAVVVEAPPSDLHWSLHPSLSAMWLFHEQVMDTVEEYGQEQLTDLVAGTSLRRRALVTCSFAAYSFVGEDLSGLTDEDPGVQLLAGLGVAGGTTECAKAWRLADEDALRRFDRTPTWGDEVARWADDVEFLRYADDQLTLLQRLGKVLVRLR